MICDCSCVGDQQSDITVTPSVMYGFIGWYNHMADVGPTSKAAQKT